MSTSNKGDKLDKSNHESNDDIEMTVLARDHLGNPLYGKDLYPISPEELAARRAENAAKTSEQRKAEREALIEALLGSLNRIPRE